MQLSQLFDPRLVSLGDVVQHFVCESRSALPDCEGRRRGWVCHFHDFDGPSTAWGTFHRGSRSADHLLCYEKSVAKSDWCAEKIWPVGHVSFHGCKVWNPCGRSTNWEESQQIPAGFCIRFLRICKKHQRHRARWVRDLVQWCVYDSISSSFGIWLEQKCERQDQCGDFAKWTVSFRLCSGTLLEKPGGDCAAAEVQSKCESHGPLWLFPFGCLQNRAWCGTACEA